MEEVLHQLVDVLSPYNPMRFTIHSPKVTLPGAGFRKIIHSIFDSFTGGNPTDTYLSPPPGLSIHDSARTARCAKKRLVSLAIKISRIALNLDFSVDQC